MNISKELLSKVLRGDIQEFTINNEGNIDFIFIGDFDEWKTINIYELAYKCKEWAFNQRYNVYSLGKWRDSGREPYLSYSATIKTFEQDNTYAMNKSYMDKFHADTEPGAVFKACEYILEKTK